ncbi:MAG TPA: alpha/beta fold hydrolase [Allosphingosinicella sp.]|jgi:dipeptidyl aminopeptidase/acylaminoacyl peptidase
MRRLRSPYLLAALPLLGLVSAWLVGSLLMASTPSDVPPPPAPARDLRLTSTDGLSLAATYWPGRTASSPAILLLHGNGASRAATAANAAWLAERGYAAMTIDLRGHGESAPAPKSFGLAESRDAAAAVAWLRQAGHIKVGVIGISLGGAAALIGDAGPVAADALVLQAVYPDIRRGIGNRIGGILGRWPAALLEPLLSFQSRLRLGVWPLRLSPIQAVAGYRGPVLVIGGGGDAHTPPQETRALYAAATEPKALWIAPRLDHKQTCDIRTDVYRQRLLAFFSATLGAP